MRSCCFLCETLDLILVMVSLRNFFVQITLFNLNFISDDLYIGIEVAKLEAKVMMVFFLACYDFKVVDVFGKPCIKLPPPNRNDIHEVSVLSAYCSSVDMAHLSILHYIRISMRRPWTSLVIWGPRVESPIPTMRNVG